MTLPIKIVDLFHGAGGFTLGAIEEGCEVVGVEGGHHRRGLGLSHRGDPLTPSPLIDLLWWALLAPLGLALVLHLLVHRSRL